MQANFTIRSMGFVRTDRRVTDRVHNKLHMGKRSGKYDKFTIRKDCRELMVWKRTESDARARHKALTVSWGSFGVDALTCAATPKYESTMTGEIEKITEAMENFFVVFPMEKEMAREELNGAFRESDYLSVDEMRQRCSAKYTLTPMPRLGNFPTDFSEEEIRRLRNNMESEVKTATDQALRDLGLRLHEAVKNIADRLASDRTNKHGQKVAPIFRDSLIGNAREILDLLPLMDMTGTGFFDPYIKQVEDALTYGSYGRVVDADTLRNNDSARAEVARKTAVAANAIGKAFNQKSGGLVGLGDTSDVDFGL
jgi:hypothetical protein